MNERYLSGIKREIVAWHQRGHTMHEISQAFLVSRAFILDALASPEPVQPRPQWSANYNDINNIGGY